MMEKKRIVFKVNKDLSDMFDREAQRQHRSRSNLLEILMVRLLSEELMMKQFESEQEDDEDDVL